MALRKKNKKGQTVGTVAGATLATGATTGAAVAAAGSGKSRTVAGLSNPDYVARQKFWTMHPRSVRVYRNQPSRDNLICHSKYRLGKSISRAGLYTFDIRQGKKKTGTIKAKLRLFGKKYTIKADGQTQTLKRPFQLFRKKWVLNNSKGKTRFRIEETTKSFLVPGVHTFSIIDAKTGSTVALLRTRWNPRRFLLETRDYALKFEPGSKDALTHSEITGIVTALGSLSL